MKIQCMASIPTPPLRAPQFFAEKENLFNCKINSAGHLSTDLFI